MKEKLYSYIFYTLNIRTFASIFEQIRSMITEFTKRFTLTTLIILGGVIFVAAQTDGHGHGDNNNHANHNVQHDGHNPLDDGEHGGFVAKDFIIPHIADANEIHFFGDHHSGFSAPLPMIFYVEGKGFDLFMSSKFHSKDGSHDEHAVLTAVGPNTGTVYLKNPETGIRSAGGESFYDISITCLLYNSDAADDLPCVDLGGRRFIKKKKRNIHSRQTSSTSLHDLLEANHNPYTDSTNTQREC